MQCRALTTFRSEQYGFIRAGSIFSSEPGYAHELLRKKMIAIVPDEIQPERVQAFGRAPQNKEEKKTLPPDEPETTSIPATSADGPARPSVLSRAARALQQKTSKRRGGSAKP